MDKIEIVWGLIGIALFIGGIWLAGKIGDAMDKENEEMEKWRKERASRPYKNTEPSESCYESRKSSGYYDVNTSDM